MTKNTTTCPATPYVCAKATKVRFTAFSISSTHMKMMIALRRVSTPTTPITNRTAEKKSASDSIRSPPAEDDRADDRRKQQNARQLERQQILGKERTRDRRDRALAHHFIGDVACRKRETLRQARAGQCKHL